MGVSRQVQEALLQQHYTLRDGFDVCQIAADVVLYLLGVPFLVWNAWYSIHLLY